MQTVEKSQVLLSMQSPERFKMLEDGWIQDAFLGLDFGPSSEETMDFEDAQKYCADKGGRLPEVHELHSLVDFTKKDPATYEILKDTKDDDWYWTNTKSKRYTDARWCVSFNFGFVYFIYESFSLYVRPCRASQD